MANFQVPVGFRFHPTDQELIYFLYKVVVEREPLMPPYNSLVHDCNLFGAEEPGKIWEDYGGDRLCNQDLYFFCELKRVNRKSWRIDRKIGDGGTWSEGEPSKLVYDVEESGNPNPVGRKGKFRFENPKSEEHTGWYLDEYSLFDGDGDDDQKASKNYYTSTAYDFDFVICRLRKNDRFTKNKKRCCWRTTTPTGLIY